MPLLPLLSSAPMVSPWTQVSPAPAAVVPVKNASTQSANVAGPVRADAPEPPTLRAGHSRSGHRYSIAKFQALDTYCRQRSGWRVFAVVVGIPLPGLISSIIPCFLPLQDLREGPNFALILHLACAVASSTFGLILTWLEVTRVPRTTYSLTQLTAVCMIATVMHCALFSCIIYFFLFPVPFAWVTATPLLFCGLVVAHLGVFGTRIWRDATLRTAVRAYGPAMVLQVSQVLLYPAFTVLYEQASTSWQLALILFFPFIKYMVKSLLKKMASQLRDFGTEVAVCGVEIAASIYQTMIMQISPSLASMICVIGIDVVHSMILVKFFLDRYANPWLLVSAPMSQLLDTETIAAEIPTRRELFPLARTLVQAASAKKPKAHGPEGAAAAGSAEIRGVALSDEHAQTLRIALETLHLAEEVLLTQYVEVFVPIVSCVFVAVASQLPSARFNPRIAMYHEDSSFSNSPKSPTPTQLLSSSVQSILLYSILQAATLVWTQWLLWHRYGISAMSFLAFILEHHALSIIGKLIAWLPVIFHFTVVQYGTDFTFTFNALQQHG